MCRLFFTLPPLRPSLPLLQTDELAVNLLWRALLIAHHSNSVFCYIHRQCLDSSTLPLISERRTLFPVKMSAGTSYYFVPTKWGFSFWKYLPKNLDLKHFHLLKHVSFKSSGINPPHKHIRDRSFHVLRLRSATFHFYICTYLTDPERLTAGLKCSLCHFLTCHHREHQTARRSRPRNKLLDSSSTKPSHFRKTIPVNSCVCFQHSCESRWGRTTQRGCTSTLKTHIKQTSTERFSPF